MSGLAKEIGLAVRIRMQRIGRTNRPYYRIVAADSRNPQDGTVIENLGTYDPASKDPAKQLDLNVERAKYWLSVGAQTTETMTAILKKQGLKPNLK